jgi:hypothetical protein
MASLFPSALPSAKTDYDSEDVIASADPNALGEDVNAIAAKVGIGSSTATTTNKILYGSGTGTTTWATPDTAGIVDKTTAQTLTNKTLTSPVINTPTGDIVSLTGTETLTNKTLTTPVIASLYQDAGKTKLMTVPDTTSDTLSAIAATQTLTNKTLTTPVIASFYQDAGKTKLMTTPDTTSDTLVTLAATQTLTNKTLTKPVVNGTNPTAATYAPATGAQTVALDCAANNMHFVTGHTDGTAITFTVANVTNSQPFIVSILQGAGTVSTIVAWFATVRWAGGSAPTLTATLNKRDTFGFIRTGSNTYDGFIIGQNA